MNQCLKDPKFIHPDQNEVQVPNEVREALNAVDINTQGVTKSSFEADTKRFSHEPKINSCSTDVTNFSTMSSRLSIPLPANRGSMMRQVRSSSRPAHKNKNPLTKEEDSRNS